MSKRIPSKRTTKKTATGHSLVAERAHRKGLKINVRPVLVIAAITVILFGVSISTYVARRDVPKPIIWNPPSSVWHNVADILTQHPTAMMVSDQSNLAKLQPLLNRKQPTLILDSCPSSGDAVNQKLQKRSFAVLLRLASTGSQQCVLAQIVKAYGRPNSSITIIGTLTDPKEVLLFYDKGPQVSGPSKPISPPTAPSTVVPINLSSLTRPACMGKTILTIIAHQDDDLLFMNPDHLHDIQGGDCMRTIYLTAGDAGNSSGYWLSRERGAEAAYDAMIAKGPSLWIERIVAVNSHEYIRMDSPKGDPNISLVFVRLPDGNITGSGFPRTHFESLQGLYGGTIATMTSVDGQSTYVKNDLITLLATLMNYFQPSGIDTQTSVDQGMVHADHSDHLATGVFAANAYAEYSAEGAAETVPLVYYTGYPIEDVPVNVAGQDLVDKSNAFYAYAVHDHYACDTTASCATGPYSQWLQREYTYAP